MPEERPPFMNGPANLLLPLALVVITLFVWAGFQTFQFVRDRQALRTLRAGQETNIQSATKVRARLDTITRKTAELAAQGNAGAKLIVEELRKTGVTLPLSPSAPAPAPPGK
jgi:hypothetical protein